MGDDNKIARIVTRVAEMIGEPTSTSAVDECSRCHEPVYVDMDQANPYPEHEQVYICTECGLESPEIAPYIVRTFLDVKLAQFLFGDGKEE